MARRRTAARSRVIRGSASPRSPGFFQKTSPVFKSFSKIYYARIVKSPLIPALVTSLRLRVSTPGPALSAAPASCSLAHRIIGLRQSYGDDHSLRHPLPSLDFKIQALSATFVRDARRSWLGVRAGPGPREPKGRTSRPQFSPSRKFCASFSACRTWVVCPSDSWRSVSSLEAMLPAPRCGQSRI